MVLTVSTVNVTSGTQDRGVSPCWILVIRIHVLMKPTAVVKESHSVPQALRMDTLNVTVLMDIRVIKFAFLRQFSENQEWICENTGILNIDYI